MTFPLRHTPYGRWGNTLFDCDRPEHGYDCYHLEEWSTIHNPDYIKYLRILIEEGEIVTPKLDKAGMLDI